jgi:hypothetical protein
VDRQWCPAASHGQANGEPCAHDRPSALPRVLRLLGTDFRPTSPDLYSIVSYVDSCGLPGSERRQEPKAYGLIRMPYGDQVCAWVTRVHEGLQFACRLPDTDVAHKNMRRCVELVRERVASVAREALSVRLQPVRGLCAHGCVSWA